MGSAVRGSLPPASAPVAQLTRSAGARAAPRRPRPSGWPSSSPRGRCSSRRSSSPTGSRACARRRGRPPTRRTCRWARRRHRRHRGLERRGGAGGAGRGARAGGAGSPRARRGRRPRRAVSRGQLWLGVALAGRVARAAARSRRSSTRSPPSTRCTSPWGCSRSPRRRCGGCRGGAGRTAVRLWGSARTSSAAGPGVAPHLTLYLA